LKSKIEIESFHNKKTKNQKLKTENRYGMLNLSTTDPGYFGKGVYITQHPKYGEY
jgi:hypothetical protein